MDEGEEDPGIEIPEPKPYRYASLKDRSDDEIAAFMGQGRTVYQLQAEKEIRDHVPAGLWDLPPKDAALTLADAHRPPEHRKNFRLEIKESPQAVASRVGALLHSYFSSRCYGSTNIHVFVRANGSESYVAWARASGAGAVALGEDGRLLHRRPDLQIRFVTATEEDALWIARTVACLHSIRQVELDSDRDRDYGSISSSTADGKAAIELRDQEKGTEISVEDTEPARWISEGWRQSYGERAIDDEQFLRLSGFLVREFVERLGIPWEGGPELSPENARATCVRALSGASGDEQEMSLDIACVAADLAGELGIREAREPLDRLGSSLSAHSEKEQAAIDDLWRLVPSREQEPWSELFRDEWRFRAYSLETFSKNPRGRKLLARDYLLRAIPVALRKIESAENPEALERWALARDEGGFWAMRRLRELDRARYVRVLQSWLPQANGELARQIFEEIQDLDAPKAVEAARHLPPDDRGPLTTRAFELLAQAEEMGDPDKRVQALLAIALDPQVGFEERGRAIDLVVPMEDPLRYPSPGIDEAMRRLLDPALGDPIVNFTLGRAAMALALRGGARDFPLVAAAFRSTGDPEVAHGLLEALALMAQAPEKTPRDGLGAILREHLRRSRWSLDHLLWAAWAADSRELRPRLVEIATASPEDVEGEEAGSYGPEREWTGRYHGPRRILALWDEEDAPTRGRLLLAMGLEDSYLFSAEGRRPELRRKMESELALLRRELREEERLRLIAFLDVRERAGAIRAGPERQFLAWARGVLSGE